MPYLNQVHLIGRLTRDPECRTAQSGTAVATFGIANNERRKDASGQWVDGPTLFVDVVAFGWCAKYAERALRKGMEVYLLGRLQLDQWDDKQTGQRRSKHKIIADTVCEMKWTKEGEGQPAQPALPMDESGDDVPF